MSTGKTNFNRKDVANQQASDDIDALIKSAGIEGEATEIRENLAELYRMADEADADEQEAEAPKEAAEDEPKPKKTGYTYDDVHGMMDAVKKGLTFEMMSGKTVEGKIYRNDAWEVNKKIYHTLKLGELRKKSEVGPTGKKNPRPHYSICKIIQNANFV